MSRSHDRVPSRRRAAVCVAVACLTLGEARGAPDVLRRSDDDQGFSILLISPTEPYLTGRQTMRIEPIIPRGDAIEQVDFFVDGRLARSDRDEPYTCDTDFGDDIRRHTIEIRALTRLGRRAKVSIVSRSGDVGEGATGPVETVAAVVRNAAGRPVDALSVSDFSLLEEGRRQPIVHFESGLAPASVAVVLSGGAAFDTGMVGDRVAAFLRGLPRHHAVALFDRPSEHGGESSSIRAFSYDAAGVASRPASAAAAITSAVDPNATAPHADRIATAVGTVADRVAAAAAALAARRGPRVMLLVLPAPADLPPDAGAGDSPAIEALTAALEATRRARATLDVVALGAEGEGAPTPLRDAALMSGGVYLEASDAAAIDRALGSVAEGLHHRYLISYMPADPTRAGWRAIELRVRGDDLVVQAPSGVFLP